jgi:hypothetical protein
VSSLIHSLLERDVTKRMAAVTDLSEFTPETFSSLSYDKLRQHPFFTQKWLHSDDSLIKFYRELGLPSDKLSDGREGDGYDSLLTLDDIRNIYQQSPPTIPLLHDVCIRAIAEVAIKVAFEISNNGGVRPDIPWVQVSLSYSRCFPFIMFIVSFLSHHRFSTCSTELFAQTIFVY